MVGGGWGYGLDTVMCFAAWVWRGRMWGVVIVVCEKNDWDFGGDEGIMV